MSERSSTVVTPKGTGGMPSVDNSATLIDVQPSEVKIPSTAVVQNPAPSKDVNVNIEPPKEQQKPKRKQKPKSFKILLLLLALLPALLGTAGFAIYVDILSNEDKHSAPLHAVNIPKDNVIPMTNNDDIVTRGANTENEKVTPINSDDDTVTRGANTENDKVTPTTMDDDTVTMGANTENEKVTSMNSDDDKVTRGANIENDKVTPTTMDDDTVTRGANTENENGLTTLSPVCPPTIQTPTGENTTIGGLPLSVIPVNYKLKLQPDVEDKLTFDGSVIIGLDIKECVHSITMNAKDLEIQKAVFKGSSGEQVTDVRLNKEKQTVDFVLPKRIYPGDGSLTVNFTGMLHDDLMGFYRNRYKGGWQQETRYQAVTQFQPAEARRCFPCFDEPSLKATFDVTLVTPKDRVALSNMPVKSEKDISSNMKEWTYDTTPIMSTYLLAFVVGEFEHVEEKHGDGTIVRVYTPMGKKETGKFGLEVSIKMLTYFNDYFGIDYPLPKVEHIAIEDMFANAMENWGLITYGPGSLLTQPSSNSNFGAVLIIGHELAHQWFGNIVTMKWWDDLWLNEGFATWMMFTSAQACNPIDGFDWWDNAAIEETLKLDALDSSHPIRDEVNKDEVDKLVSKFDTITYDKGRTVVRMLENYIGNHVFKKGMQNYMQKYKYKNTVTEDLWAVLEEVSQVKVGEMMDTWTKKMGFPLLNVVVSKTGNQKRLTISQKKFKYVGTENADYHWQIPVYYISKSNSTPTCLGLMVDKDKNWPISLPDGDWIKLNPRNIAFYRVNYDSKLLEAMKPSIADLSMSQIERMQILSDLFALNRIGLTSFENVLDTLKFYKKEDLGALVTHISSFRYILQEYTQSTDCLEAFKTWTISFLRGRDAEDEKLAAFGDGDVINKVLAQKTKIGRANLDNNWYYRTILQNDGEDVFDEIVKLYDQSKQNFFLSYLGSVRTEKLIKRVLEDFTFSRDLTSMQKLAVLLELPTSNLGRVMAWNFYMNNTEKFDKMSVPHHLMILQKIIEGFASEDRATEVEDFFQRKPLPGAELRIKQNVENIRLNVRWLDKEMAGIKEYLNC